MASASKAEQLWSSNGQYYYTIEAEFNETSTSGLNSYISVSGYLKNEGTRWDTTYESNIALYWYDDYSFTGGRLLASLSFAGTKYENGSGSPEIGRNDIARSLSVTNFKVPHNPSTGNVSGKAMLSFVKGSTTSAYAPGGNGSAITANTALTHLTPLTAPIYNTTTVVQISNNSVSLAASINNGGATITAGGWQLSIDGGTNWTTYSGDWNAKYISGLTRATTYTYRGYATNSIGTTYSTPSTFTTLKEIPVISTPVVSNITSNSAYISYTITDAGGGTVSSNVIKVYDVNADVLVATINSNAGTATGLSPNTLYAADGQATNEVGTSIIKSATFTTLAAQGLPVSINGGAFSNKTIYLSVNGGSFNNIGANIKTSVNGGSF